MDKEPEKNPTKKDEEEKKGGENYGTDNSKMSTDNQITEVTPSSNEAKDGALSQVKLMADQLKGLKLTSDERDKVRDLVELGDTAESKT